MSSTQKRAIVGTIWTLVNLGGSQVMRFVSNLILVRLLAPREFGLMGTVYTLLVGLHLLSDLGLRQSMIQNKRGEDPDFVNTIWTMQVVRSIIIYGACLLITWPAAVIYKEPNLFWLIPIISLSTLSEGFSSTAEITLSRRVELSRLTKFTLLIDLLSQIVTITWAYFNPTIWAFVAGTLVVAVLNPIVSYCLIPKTVHRFTWDKEAAREILSFGKWIFFSTAVTYAATQSDRLILPKLESFDVVGVYFIALTLAIFPQDVLAQVADRVLFPLISENADLPRSELREKLLRKRGLLLAAMAFCVAILVCFGDFVIQLLYSVKSEGMQAYTAATWMLPILALGIWPNVLFESLAASLMALGKPNYNAFSNFFKGFYMVTALPLSFHYFGLPGFVVAVALNDLPLYATMAYGLWREKLSGFKQDIFATALLALFIVIFLAGRQILGLGLPIDTLLQQGAGG